MDVFAKRENVKSQGNMTAKSMAGTTDPEHSCTVAISKDDFVISDSARSSRWCWWGLKTLNANTILTERQNTTWQSDTVGDFTATTTGLEPSEVVAIAKGGFVESSNARPSQWCWWGLKALNAGTDLKERESMANTSDTTSGPTTGTADLEASSIITVAKGDFAENEIARPS